MSSVQFGLIICRLKGGRLTGSHLLKMIYCFSYVVQWLQLKADNQKVAGSRLARSKIWAVVSMSEALTPGWLIGTVLEINVLEVTLDEHVNDKDLLFLIEYFKINVIYSLQYTPHDILQHELPCHKSWNYLIFLTYWLCQQWHTVSLSVWFLLLPGLDLVCWMLMKQLKWTCLLSWHKHHDPWHPQPLERKDKQRLSRLRGRNFFAKLRRNPITKPMLTLSVQKLSLWWIIPPSWHMYEDTHTYSISAAVPSVSFPM